MFLGLDFGSNTLRVVAMSEDGSVHFRKEFIVKTARGLKKTGEISHEAKENIRTALRSIQAQGFSLINAAAVGTAVYRLAKNAKDFVDEIKEEFKLDLKIISPFEEARLSKLALRYERQKLGYKADFYFCDLGGASMEIGYKNTFKSLHCGIISMYEKSRLGIKSKRILSLLEAGFKLKGKGGMKKGRNWHMGKKVASKKRGYAYAYLPVKLRPGFKGLKISLRNHLKIARKFLEKTDVLVVNSGTPALLSAYKMGIYYANYQPSLVNGQSFKNAEFLPLILKLLKDKNRNKYLGKNSLKYLLVGAFILASLGKDAQIIDSGISEGLCVQALALFQN